jgi:uncharacterized membrane protein YczE
MLPDGPDLPGIALGDRALPWNVSSSAAAPSVLPLMPWASPTRWRARPRTLAVLLVGLWLFGTGEALLVRSRLGNTPWTVLAQGVSRHSPLSIGLATLAISLTVLLLWVPLRERPGLGTVANALVIALAIDVTLRWLPAAHSAPLGLLAVAAGVLSIGLGSALYLTTALGPGPRDGWMTGIARRTALPVPRVRLGLELVVLVAGFLLGGRVGIGTVVFALTVGQAIRLWLGLLVRATGRLR